MPNHSINNQKRSPLKSRVTKATRNGSRNLPERWQMQGTPTMPQSSTGSFGEARKFKAKSMPSTPASRQEPLSPAHRVDLCHLNSYNTPAWPEWMPHRWDNIQPEHLDLLMAQLYSALEFIQLLEHSVSSLKGQVAGLSTRPVLRAEEVLESAKRRNQLVVVGRTGHTAVLGHHRPSGHGGGHDGRSEAVPMELGRLNTAEGEAAAKGAAQDPDGSPAGDDTGNTIALLSNILAQLMGAGRGRGGRGWGKGGRGGRGGRQGGRGGRGPPHKATARCFNCNEPGHYAKECPHPPRRPPGLSKEPEEAQHFRGRAA